MSTTSIWEYSSRYRASCEERSSGREAAMDCARQLVELLRPQVRPGMSLLDVGCGAGHYYLSLQALGVEYYGIDASPTAIDIAKRNLPRAGLNAARFRCMPLEDLPPEEHYDIVVCFNTMMYAANYHRPLALMLHAARQLLVVRDCFEEQTQYRWEADILLDEGYKHMPAYFNIWGRDEIAAFVTKQGFVIDFVADARRRDVQQGAAEVVGGIALPYEIFMARPIDRAPA